MTVLKRKIWTLIRGGSFKGYLRTVSGYPLTLTGCMADKPVSLAVSGNTVQDGTPTPDNPVEVRGVGERTKNLFNKDKFAELVKKYDTTAYEDTIDGRHCIVFNNVNLYRKDFSEAAQFGSFAHTMRMDIKNVVAPTSGSGALYIAYLYNGEPCPTNVMEPYPSVANSNRYRAFSSSLYADFKTITITSAYTDEVTATGFAFSYGTGAIWAIDLDSVMLNEGTTSLPYEPYGYKVPLRFGGRNLFDVEKFKGVSSSIPDEYEAEIDAKKCVCAKIGYFTKAKYGNFFSNIDTEEHTFCLDIKNLHSATNSVVLLLTYEDGTTSSVSQNIPAQSWGRMSLVSTAGKRLVGFYISYYTNKEIAINCETAALVKGSYTADTLPPYEPYHEPVTYPIYLDAPLYGMTGVSDKVELDVENRTATLTRRLSASDTGEISELSTPTTTDISDKIDWDRIPALWRGTAIVSADTTVEPGAIITKYYADKPAKIFSVGEQLTQDWTDNRAGTSMVYKDVPMTVVHLSESETDKSGNTLKGMFLQWAYTTPFGMPFDAKEALYDVPEGGMSAGTYHFKVIGIPSNWASYANNNKYFSFTLPEDLPEGYQLVLSGGYATKDFAGTYIDIYSSPTEFTPIAQAILAEGETGTYLGVTDGKGDLNYFTSAVEGYNYYKYSAIRQWLNSSEGVGKWWTKQHKWDRAPSQLNTYAGFLSGYSADFIAAMKPIEVQTATSNLTDYAKDIVYDKVFLPSLEQMYIEAYFPGEGTAWEFYKQLAAVNNRTSAYKRSKTYAELKRYAINAKTTPQNVHLRSNNNGTAYYTWYIATSGFVASDLRNTQPIRLCPVCFI